MVKRRVSIGGFDQDTHIFPLLEATWRYILLAFEIEMFPRSIDLH